MLKKQLVKAENRGDENEVLHISKKMDDLGALRPFKLIVTEGTTEGLAKMMAGNGGRIAIVSAEGALFDILTGAYATNGVNIDLVLQGYSGEPVSSARITRNTERIEKACLSITLAVQPIAIERLLSNEAMIGRGVAGRFLFSSPESLLGSRKVRDVIPLSPSTSAKYGEVLNTILSVESVSLELSPEAYDTYVHNTERIEERLKVDGDLRRLPSGWGGKISGNTIRIAGLLALLDGERRIIPDSAMRGAISIAEYFISQFKYVTGLGMSITPSAAEVLQFLKRQGEQSFIPRVLRQALRGRRPFEKGEMVDQALEELASVGYIRQGDLPDWNGRGRRPEPICEVHPGLFNENVR